MKKIILILLFFISSSFAVETAYGWGYGDLLVETLRIVKYVFSINEFKDIWKVAVLISMIFAFITMLTPNPDYFRIPKIFIITTLVWTIFSTAKIDIYVEDKVDNNNSGLVTNVPWAVGYPLALFSAIEYRLGATYEVATSIPNGMKYSDSGFLTPISIFKKATKHQIVSPYIHQNLTNYIQECVMPDLENGYKDYRSLVDSENVWAYLGNTSPATFILINDEDNNSSLVTCPTAYSQLNNALQNYVGIGGLGMEHLGKTLGSLTSGVISSQLGIANQYLLNTSKTASQMLLQNVAINTFSESFRNYVNINGGDLNNVAYHSASAQQAASAQMIVSGVLGSEYIPVIKGILTTIIIGLTPVVALMMITPMYPMVFKGYIMILFWLSCWHLGDVILNHIIIVKAQSALSSYGDIKFNTIGLIDSATTNYINMASNMYWMIPSIALFIATGFSLGMFAALGNSAGSKLDRNASVVGTDMAKGNMQFANVSHDTYNGNKTNATRENNFGQNTNYMDFASGEFGTQSSTVNGKSSQSGMQSFGGGIQENTVNNTLAKELGQGYNFNMGKFDGQDIGRGQKKATEEGSIQSTNSDGQNVTFDYNSGSIFKKGEDGKYQPHTGIFTAYDNGKSIESVYKDGKEVSRTLVDEQKNKVEATTMENGIDKSFKWESGQDKGSFVSGVYYAKSGELNLTDGVVNGSTLKKDDNSNTTYSMGELKSAVSAMQRQLSNNITNTSTEQETDNKITEKGSTETNTEKSSHTKEGSLGFKALGNGVSTTWSEGNENSYSDVIVDKNSNTVTLTDSKNEQKSFTLSENEMNQLQNQLRKETSNSSGILASRDLTAQRLESILQKGIESGLDVNTTMKNIVQNKDSYHSGSVAITNNGVSDNVGNVLSEENVSKNINPVEVERPIQDRNKLENKPILDNENAKNKEEPTKNQRDETRNLLSNLEKKGAIKYSEAPDKQSVIKDWSQIEKLPKEDIEKLKDYADFGGFGKNTQNELHKIYQDKSISHQVPNGDGNIRLEPGLKGLEEATKVIVSKQEKQQPIEQVNDKK